MHALANGAGTNDDCVADHALGLLLATVRAIPHLDSACRRGVWRDAAPMRPQLARKRLGILGMGAIGCKIAQRGAAFELAVGYHNRSSRADLPHRYFDSPQALAQWCDFLVVATPGGAGTRHLVDASVLEALGPDGFLVNIARGSVVDTEALARVLRAGGLGGAGLDVYESEPLPPAVLMDLPNVVLTPHVAGWSPESMQASLQCFLDNVALHFAGQPLRTPI
jgi:D-3-phosphoglycerate dehydrogenase